MKPVTNKADTVTAKLRAIVDDADPAIAVIATWRVALATALCSYGPAITANALRDLADEVERDLMAPRSEVMQ